MKTNLPQFILSMVILSGITISSIQAQSVLPPAKAEIFLKILPGDTTIKKNQSIFPSMQSAVQVTPNTQQEGTLYVVLGNGDDGSNVSFIHVKLMTLTDSVLFEKAFQNSEGIFSDGTYMSKKGIDWFFGLNRFQGLNSFKSEVYFEGQSGQTSPVVSYIKQ